MRIGFGIVGVIDPSTCEEFIRVSSQTAEACGFSSYWVPEHVVLFEQYPRSKYPYAAFSGTDAPIPDPTTPLPDPIVTLTWAACSTKTIEVATGILILPQRNPLVVAKQLATLDVLSGGRVLLGAGVGWCREEYEALGVPWDQRGSVMDEHVQALQALWRDPVSSFHGAHVSFDRAYSYPKPRKPSGIPVLCGGESDPSLRRIAKYGDGWVAFDLSVGDAPRRIKQLHELTRAQGRDPGLLRIFVSIFDHTTLDDMKRYRDAGVTDLYHVAPLPMNGSQEIKNAVERVADKYVAAVSAL